MPTFELLMLYFGQPKEVCPVPFVDDYILYLLEAEQAAREYHTLPYGGGLWDQPKILIEYFTYFRMVRNEYERIRMDRLQKESKSKTKSNPGSIEGNVPEGNLNLPPRRSNM